MQHQTTGLGLCHRVFIEGGTLHIKKKLQDQSNKIDYLIKQFTYHLRSSSSRNPLLAICSLLLNILHPPYLSLSY